MGNSTTREQGTRCFLPRSDEQISDAKLALNLYWACRLGNHHVAGNLAARGAHLNVLHPDSGESALHVAAFHVHVKVVNELLKYGADPNLYSGLPRGETPLHCAVRAAQSPCAQWTQSRALQCVNALLLHPKIKVDCRDICGLSPVHLAAQFELWEFVRYLITAGASIDMDMGGGETTRGLLERNNPSRLSLTPTRVLEPMSLKTLLYNEIVQGEQDKFITSFSAGNLNINLTTLQKFLQISCVNGYSKVARFLIERGADPINSVNDTQIPPIVLAAKYGYHDTLKVLLDVPMASFRNVIDHPLWKRTALHHVAISAANVTTSNNKTTRDYVMCTSLLLQNALFRHLDVNATDFLGNTALHYASKSGRRDIVRIILNHTPAIFIKNSDNIPAFVNIHPHDIRKYLDSCISVKSSKQEKFPTIVLDYKFLVTPDTLKNKINNIGTKTNYEEVVPQKKNEIKPLEMDGLVLLSNSPIHRHLLNHSIIRAFLQLKWQRVKYYFYINFILYLMFTIALSLHIHMLVTNTFVIATSSVNGTRLNKTNEYTIIGSPLSKSYEYDAVKPHNIIRWITAIFLLWPLFREIVEMCMSPRRYVKNFENYIEMILVVISIVLLFVQIDYYHSQILSAIAILLAYTELVLLIGRHPKFAIYINMFTKVSKHFLGFFFLFSFLIFAFAYSFFIIFHNCREITSCETRYFTNLWSSIFKTIVMLTGEFETENLTFDVFGHLLFTCFILFMTICLLNLLTGLAVSDITAIKDEAEVDSCHAKVKLYAKIESILLGQSIEGLGVSWLGARISAMAERMFAGKIRLLGHLLPENHLEVLMAADRSTRLDSVSWSSRMTSVCLSGGNHASSAHYHEWNSIVNDAQFIAMGENQMWQNRGLPEKLESIETRLAELLEVVNGLKLQQTSIL